eukprot:s589_g7.t1
MAAFSLSMMPKEDLICTGCGKDPYHSGTGCLCPLGTGNWVPKSDADAAKEVPVARSAADDGDVVCTCGQLRARASKAPDRVLPCRHCGDGARAASELAK